MSSQNIGEKVNLLPPKIDLTGGLADKRCHEAAANKCCRLDCSRVTTRGAARFNAGINENVFYRRIKILEGKLWG